MHLILTHEQADFDAIASLCGAFLLDEKTLPVLPRRINRNVRDFLTLYGAEFTLNDPRDLPTETIDSVMLVDTQSLVTIKGMGKNIKVRVIDHHPRRTGLPNDWQILIDEIGATTTLIVEYLQERNGHLSPIQATLLLLGIYEDTGSLAYGSTTARDVHAAAYLLEHGACLKIAAEFLNPPLSAEQRNVFEHLLSNAETHLTHGQRVIVACGDADEVSEEISTLAHKLMDILDPDALFVLVNTKEGIRMVGRSTTDQIDVAAVLAQFNGGGHNRAAAALVHVESGKSQSEALEKTRHKLIDILPSFIKASVTVAKIMSHNPHMLTPETPVQDAAHLMQRYGYEGYPVVQNGKVIGLLTRRAVDRAISHRLNLTAGSLMDAGEITIRPDDSLQQLQACMTSSGWGQVPVVDAQTGEIVGIVTRTDLLKSLSPRSTSPSEKNLAQRLEKALPSEYLKLVQVVAKEATNQKIAIYIVGGFVRDLLLERPSFDLDIVVEGDAISLARSLSKMFGGRFTGHSRFRTAKWFLEGSQFGRKKGIPSNLDLISARTEFYEHPTALPIIERSSIKLDLHRRDFTINTLAIRLDGRHYGELYDHWGGFADLTSGVVRVLHSLSFVDDPTRLLRAVRFEQRFGFKIEDRTLELMSEARTLLEKLSGERIRHELDLILDEERATQMLMRLATLNLLTAINPDLSWDGSMSVVMDSAINSQVPREFEPLPEISGVSRRRTLGYLIWFMALPHGKLSSIIKRLRFPSALVKVLSAASKLWNDLPKYANASPSVWSDRLEEVPSLAIYANMLMVSEKNTLQSLREYLVKWRHIKPVIDGNDLIKRGLTPGPLYQDILRRLRTAWLDGKIKTPEEEIGLLEQLIKEHDQAND